MPSSLQIAQEATLRPITEIAAAAGLEPDEIDPYGRYKAKVSLSVLDRLASKADGKLIDVTAITPTKAGEGKTTTSVSLTQGLGHIGKSVALCLREASLGPVFGIKGGAAGGGYTQVVPMEDMNLHFTGDIHAIGAANNLLAAMLEAHLLHGNALDIDPLSVSWRRCMDINDRALRDIVVGLGGKANGYPRQTGFDITAASEVMAIVAVASDLCDLRARLGAITVGSTYDGEPVTAEQLRAAGSMAVLLKETIKPNLVQTLEGQPAFVHCGPFANIAHGNNSVVADRVALKLADYVVTESGFASDMGMEKFFDIVCRLGNLQPDAVVLVATVKALKHHAGRSRRRHGRDRDRRREHGAPPRHRPRVRAERRRRRQPLPRRHRRGGRAREADRARARRLRRRGQRRLHARRRGRRGARRGGRRRGRRAVEVRLHLPARRPDRGQDRGDRETRLRGRRDLPSAGRTCEDQGVQQARGSTACRSAWRRRISRSRTTRCSRTRRPASPSACATCGRTRAPAGSWRSAATCRRCPGSARRPRRSTSTSTSGARRLGSSNGHSSPLIRAEGIWKIFGKNADKVIGTPDAELSRARAAREDRLRRGGARRLVRGVARRGVRRHGPLRAPASRRSSAR